MNKNNFFVWEKIFKLFENINLFGRIPSFAVPHTVIRSCSRFHSVSYHYLVVLQSSQHLIPLSGCAPGFTVSYTTIWSIPGFIVFQRNQNIIRSISRLHNLNLRCTTIWSGPGFIVSYTIIRSISRLHSMVGEISCYPVDFWASQLELEQKSQYRFD